MRVINVVGARPNFMKIAPVQRQMEVYPSDFEPILVHTGQHYDERMSKLFFDDLDLPKPDVYLGVGSGSHAEQTAKVMTEFESVCLSKKPEMVIVVGDVNSTMACSIVCAKLCIPFAHVEAGLRSFDRTMPEEVNRAVTDVLADILFTSEKSGNVNLEREGIASEKISFVGNVMIDSLDRFLKATDSSSIFQTYGFRHDEYALLTLHRPSNVDDEKTLDFIVETIAEIERQIAVVFPVHPRTENSLKGFGLYDKIRSLRGVRFLPPLGYIDFMNLMKHARFVMTDSGGIQEETTFLGIPCLTLRENTERPCTVDIGTNEVVGTDRGRILSCVERVLSNRWKTGGIPPLWDGRAAERIVDHLKGWSAQRG